jgi:hypothetical protein
MSERVEADQRLIESLRLTGNPPRAWIEAATLIPDTLGDLATIDSALASQSFRARFAQNPESAVAEAGLPSSPALVAALRARLS